MWKHASHWAAQCASMECRVALLCAERGWVNVLKGLVKFLVTFDTWAEPPASQLVPVYFEPGGRPRGKSRRSSAAGRVSRQGRRGVMY